MTTYQISTGGLTPDTVEAAGFVIEDGALILIQTLGKHDAVAAYPAGHWRGVRALDAASDGGERTPTVVHQTISGPAPVATPTPAPEVPRPPAPADTDSGSTSASVTSESPAAAAAAPATPPAAGEKPKRRRTKAQKEEDERDGLEADFQRALKDHPNLDVDTIRDMIRGNREAADSEAERDHEAAARSHAAETVPEAFVPDDSADGVDNAPAWDAPAWDAPPAVEAAPAEDDNASWTPNW